MKIRYNIIYGILMLMAGAITLITTIILDESNTRLFIAGLQLALGVMMVNTSIFMITDTELKRKNLYGITLQRYTFNSLDQLYVQDGYLFFSTPERTIRIARLAKYMFRHSDIRRLTEKLGKDPAKK
jgi:hypothetical protein